MNFSYYHILKSKYHLIRYNLFTKRKDILFSSNHKINDYYVSEENLIVSVKKDYSNSVYWNGLLVKDCDFKHFKFVETADGNYITNETGEFYNTIDYIIIPPIFYCTVSPNGRRFICYVGGGCHYILDIWEHYLTSNYEFGEYAKYFFNGFYTDIQWIDNNYLLVNCNIVLNLERDTKMEISLVGEYSLHIVNDSLLVVFEADYLHFLIYDLVSMTFLAQIKHGIYIDYYYHKFDIFVTYDNDYYRLVQKNDQFKLVKIQIGYNYIFDLDIVPVLINNVMNVVLDSCVLFDSLPPEIINVELYQQLLHPILHFLPCYKQHSRYCCII